MKFTVQSITVHKGIIHLSLGNSSGRRLTYRAGQYATIALKKRGRKTPTRCFSIVSAPNDQTLDFGIRQLGDFTHTLSELSPGQTVYVQGPFGQFNVNRDYDQEIVLLAGGIGITPYLSIIRDQIGQGNPIPMTLFFSCRSTTDAPFASELLELEKKATNFRIIWLFSDGTTPPNPNLTVYGSQLTEAILKKELGANFGGKTYFICGPDGYMKSFQDILIRNGVSTDRVLSESFRQITTMDEGIMSLPRLTYAATALAVVIATLGITALDLRTHALAASNSSAATNTSSTSSTTTATPSGSTSGSATTSTTNGSQTNATSQTSSSSYQQPVSSVS